MDRMIFLTEAGLLMLQVVGGALGVMLISYLSTLIYDEVRILRQKSPYEIWLAAMVGAEFLINGKPGKDIPTPDYRGRHREEDTFISDLVSERREDPTSLCYNHFVPIDEGDLKLCGVF